jgi:hypothetical protein
MIVIKSASDAGIVGSVGGRSFLQDVVIVADSEAEITALGGVGDEVEDMYHTKTRPNAGSTAVTVTDGVTVRYILLPKGWTKAG